MPTRVLCSHSPSQHAKRFCFALLQQVRRLSPRGGRASRLKLAATATRQFVELKDVHDVGTDVYCIPASPNFPAMDALLQPNKLFQMTVTQKLKVNAAGLAQAIEALRPTPRQSVRFYFVVPSAVGQSSDGLFAAYRPVPHMQGVEQWVLEVPVVPVGAHAPP